MSHVYCTECGFQNPEAANYCAKCGALLEKEDAGSETTLALTPEELADDPSVVLDGLEGPALVVRSGGGRAGEHFIPRGERTTIGRRPDSEVFLDDVTVSRDHALLIHRGDQWFLDDLGSLNGTYVNRTRIESQKLEEGDEVQIGKYKLTFHVR